MPVHPTTIHGAILIVAWSLFTPFFLITSTLFFLRRHIQPIQQRAPILCYVSAWAGYLMFTFACWIQYVSPQLWPCEIQLWGTWLIYPLYFFPYPVRCWRLYCIFRLNEERGNYGAFQTGPEGKVENRLQSYVFKNRYRFTEPYLFRIIGLLLIPEIITAIIIQCVDPTQTLDDLGCEQTDRYFIVILVLFTIFMVVALFSVYGIRRVRDEFNIKDEMIACLFVWLFTVIPFAVVGLVVDRNVNRYHPMHYLMAAFTSGTYLVSVCLALYRSYIQKKELPFLSLDTLSSLQKVLGDRTTCEYFKQFLIQEFSVENLQFYTSAVAYHRLTNHEEMIKAAHKIFEDFIEDNALLQVNVNHDLKLKIQKELDNPNQDTFRGAEQSIFNLMVADSYPRFLKVKCVEN